MKIINRYIAISRLMPAILTSLPFFALYHFSLKASIGDFLNEIFKLEFASDLTISLAIIYFMSQLNRVVSKALLETKIFQDGLCSPTTNILLHVNSYFSPDYTNQIHDRISRDFGIKIPPRDKELLDEAHSRQKIREAISLVRVMVGHGKLTGQHNAEYGFARNLVGGSLIALIIALVNVFVFYVLSYSALALAVNVVLAFIYAIVVFYRRHIVNMFGNDYAKVLIQEYMAKK